MALTNQQEKSLEEKLKLMTNYDPDRQFIAACDLSEFIDKNPTKMPPVLLSKIIDALIEHLKSETIDVHGNAIKCLSKIIPKVPVNESKRVCQMMVRSVADPNLTPVLRDVYGTCVKTIINDVPFNVGQHIKDLLKLTIQAFISAAKRGNSLKTEEELVDIAITFMRKWPRIVGKIDADRRQFGHTIINNIIKRDDIVLKKRSIICLGVLSHSLNKAELSQLLFHHGIITFLKENRNQDRVSLEKKKFALQALSNILKSQNNALADYASNLSQFLIEQASYLLSCVQDGKIQKSEQMIQSVLISLQSIFRIVPHTQPNPILNKLITEFLVFSPQSDIRYSTQDMEEEEEQFEQDTDDSSWKVRKAALQLISITPQQASQFIMNPATYTPITETNNEVSEAAMNMCLEMLSILSNHGWETPMSQFCLKNIHKQLDGFFKSSYSYDSKVYTTASRLIFQAGKKLTSTIIQNPEILRTYMHCAGESIKKAKTNEAKIFLLNFVQVIASKHSFSSYQPVLQILIALSQNPFYKISVAALRATYALLSQSYSNINENDEEFKQLVSTLLNKAVKTDVDQQLKQCTFACIGQLLDKYHNKIKSELFIKILSERLAGEVDKRYILSTICRINENISVVPVDDLNNIVRLASTVCLPVADVSIRSKAAQAIDTCVTILKGQLKPDIAMVAANNSKDFIADGETPVFFNNLCRYHAELLLGTVDKLINMHNPPTECIKYLYNAKNAVKEEIVHRVTISFNNDNLEKVAELLHALQVSSSKLVADVLNEDTKNAELKLGLLAIEADPKNYETFIKIAQNQKKGHHIRMQAVIGLGNVIKSIKQIETLIKHDKYLALVALRQMIIKRRPNDRQLQKQLFDFSLNQNQSVLNIISECVGFLISYEKQSPEFLSHYKSNRWQHRFVCANMYRYVFNSNSHFDVGPYLAPLVEMLEDHELQVQASVLKSLNIVVHYSPQKLKTHLTPQLVQKISNMLIFDPKNVEQLRMGSIVQKYDRAKTLKIDAFSLMDSLIRKVLPKDINLYQNILENCLTTIDFDISVDVQVRRLTTVLQLLDIENSLISHNINMLAQKLSVDRGILKQSKKEDHSSQHLIDLSMRLHTMMNRAVGKENTAYAQEYQKVVAVEKYRNILSSMASE